MTEKIIFLNSHPIQYFAPLYMEATRQGIPVEVWYCSDESIRGARDVEFGQHVKWDIPLLEGYAYRFFKNHSWKPSIHNGFFGLVNLGLIKALRKSPPSLLVVHGWNFASSIIAIAAAKLYNHKVALRGETPLNQELLKTKGKLLLRKFVLGRMLFKLFDHILYIGKRNKAFYEYYGINNGQLVFTPYSIDNERFRKAWLLAGKAHNLRQQLGIPVENLVILYSGKYIPKKRPMDLLAAFSKLPQQNLTLVMMGDGELKPTMERFIKEEKLKNVILTGFINQKDIVNYYAMSDVFVMCSQQGETWGLSVNEAMNFHLPIVVSDVTGCSVDLVEHAKNGFIFSVGNVEELANTLQTVANMPALQRKEMGDRSAAIVQNFSYDVIITNLKTLIA